MLLCFFDCGKKCIAVSHFSRSWYLAYIPKSSKCFIWIPGKTADEETIDNADACIVSITQEIEITVVVVPVGVSAKDGLSENAMCHHKNIRQ